MKSDFNRKQVKKWMISNKESFIDPLTGEINATSLAESAANAFDADYIDGPLDDETHWIWEIALEVK